MSAGPDPINIQEIATVIAALIGAFRIVSKIWTTSTQGYVVSAAVANTDGSISLVPDRGWRVWIVWLFDLIFSVKPKTKSVASDRVTIAALHKAPPHSGEESVATAILLSCVSFCLFSSAVLTTGCLGYKHARYDPASGNPIETTRISSPFLTKTSIEGLKSNTEDSRSTNGASKYRRVIGVTSAENKVDTEGVNALESLIGRAILTGLGAPQLGGGVQAPAPQVQVIQVPVPATAPPPPPPAPVEKTGTPKFTPKPI